MPTRRFRPLPIQADHSALARLGERELRLAERVAAGEDLVQAMRDLGWSERSLKERASELRRSPAKAHFRDGVRILQDLRVVQAASRAVAVLEKQVADTNPAVAARAAKILLDVSGYAAPAPAPIVVKDARTRINDPKSAEESIVENFASLPAAERKRLLRKIEAETAKRAGKSRDDGDDGEEGAPE